MSKIVDAIRRQTESSQARGKSTPQRVRNRLSHADGIPLASSTGLFTALSDTKQLFPIDPSVAEANRLIISPRYEQVASPYKILRTRLLHRMRTNHWSRLAVTSCGPGEGKTLTSINLAISLARQEHQNVILFDLDLVRPKVLKYLGINPNFELADYLHNDASINDLIISPAIDGLLIIGSESPIDNSSEMLRSTRMLELLDTVTSDESSTIVVFDMPPLLGSDDVLAFAPLIDALLLVVTPGKTSRAELNRAREFIDDFNLIGTTLNKSDESVTPYY